MTPRNGDHAGAGRDLPAAERQLDIGTVWRAITPRWWLMPIGVVLGALIGFAVIHGKRENYKASTEFYVGDIGPADQLPTSLALVSQFVIAESSLRKAARAAHLNPASLRNNVTTSLVLGPNSSRSGASPSALIDITVSGTNARATAKAADALAGASSTLLASYPRHQLRLTLTNLARDRALLKDTSARLNTNLRLRQQLGFAAGVSSTRQQGIIVAFSRESAVEFKQRRLLRQEVLAAELQANFDRTMSPRVTRAAEAVPQGSPSRTTGILVAALIGLLLAALIAIARQASLPPKTRLGP